MTSSTVSNTRGSKATSTNVTRRAGNGTDNQAASIEKWRSGVNGPSSQGSGEGRSRKSEQASAGASRSRSRSQWSGGSEQSIRLKKLEEQNRQFDPSGKTSWEVPTSDEVDTVYFDYFADKMHDLAAAKTKAIEAAAKAESVLKETKRDHDDAKASGWSLHDELELPANCQRYHAIWAVKCFEAAQATANFVRMVAIYRRMNVISEMQELEDAKQFAIANPKEEARVLDNRIWKAAGRIIEFQERAQMTEAKYLEATKTATKAAERVLESVRLVEKEAPGHMKTQQAGDAKALEAANIIDSAMKVKWDSPVPSPKIGSEAGTNSKTDKAGQVKASGQSQTVIDEVGSNKTDFSKPKANPKSTKPAATSSNSSSNSGGVKLPKSAKTSRGSVQSVGVAAGKSSSKLRLTNQGGNNTGGEKKPGNGSGGSTGKAKPNTQGGEQMFM